jgi:ubiquinone/menaquinone biosynthesis C-methylase UbiE
MSNEQMRTGRYWQNWDEGKAARRIDEYWIASEAEWRKMLAQDLKREFGVNAPIVEVGCGTGLIFKALLDEGVVTEQSYLGGDVSLNMLAIARERFPQARVREMDVLHLDLPSHSRLNVICIHVLQHLPGYEEALLELLRVAQRKLYVVSWFNRETEDLQQFSPPSDRWDNQQFFNNRYSLSKFVSFLYLHSEKPIVEVRIHHFEGENYGIAVTFAP